MLEHSEQIILVRLFQPLKVGWLRIFNQKKFTIPLLFFVLEHVKINHLYNKPSNKRNK